MVDDVNGLSKTSEFPNWYKSLSETIDFRDDKVSVAFTLVSFPELTEYNPSFSRIFHVIELDNVLK